jgi:RND family efflux transporter MFP subunit
MLNKVFSTAARPVWVVASSWLATALIAALGMPQAQGAPLQTVTLVAAAPGAGNAFEGQVEAVRQTTLAAQVPASIEQVAVKVGDRVKAGQLLVRLDARAANQGTSANQAQVGAARASLEAVSRELERKRQLVAKNYISQAALEQAEAQYKVAKAQVDAQSAQVGVSQAQAGFYQVHAPYAGIISAVSVEKGDMAMPGRALVSLYDPSRLRVTAAVPASALVGGATGPVQLEIAGMEGAPIPSRGTELLPTVDPQSLTRQLRAELPTDLVGVVPGLFARVRLPNAAAPSDAKPLLRVPLTAVVRRSEMVGVYVVTAQGKALLRQVRLGPVSGNEVQVLSGLQAGERVAVDAQQATRQP